MAPNDPTAPNSPQTPNDSAHPSSPEDWGEELTERLSGQAGPPGGSESDEGVARVVARVLGELAAVAPHDQPRNAAASRTDQGEPPWTWSTPGAEMPDPDALLTAEPPEPDPAQPVPAQLLPPQPLHTRAAPTRAAPGEPPRARAGSGTQVGTAATAAHLRRVRLGFALTLCCSILGLWGVAVLALS